MTAFDLRPLSIGEIVARAATLWVRVWLTLLALFTITSTPKLIENVALTFAPPFPRHSPTFLFVNSVTALVSGVLWLLAINIAVRVLRHAYDGERGSLGEAARAAWRDFFDLFCIALTLCVIAGVAVLALAVFGRIFGVIVAAVVGALLFVEWTILLGLSLVASILEAIPPKLSIEQAWSRMWSYDRGHIQLYVIMVMQLAVFALLWVAVLQALHAMNLATLVSTACTTFVLSVIEQSVSAAILFVLYVDLWARADEGKKSAARRRARARRKVNDVR
jgi:hypothetical protein